VNLAQIYFYFLEKTYLFILAQMDCTQNELIFLIQLGDTQCISLLLIKIMIILTTVAT